MSKSWEEISLKTLGVRGPTNDSRSYLPRAWNRAAGWKCGHRHMLTSLRLLQNRCVPQVLPLLLLSAPSWRVPAGTSETKPRENWLGGGGVFTSLGLGCKVRIWHLYTG